MMQHLWTVLLCLLVNIVAQNNDSSENKIVRIHPKTKLDYIEIFSLSEKFQVDIWSKPSQSNGTVWASIPDDDDMGEAFLRALDKVGIGFDIAYKNMEAYLALHEETQPRGSDLSSQASGSRPERASLFDRYYRYKAMENMLKDWAARHPQQMKLLSIGKTHEGRDILLVVVNNEPNDGNRRGDSNNRNNNEMYKDRGSNHGGFEQGFRDDGTSFWSDTRRSFLSGRGNTFRQLNDHDGSVYNQADRGENRSQRPRDDTGPNRRGNNHGYDDDRPSGTGGYNGRNTGDPRAKRSVIIECGIHSREWISSATCLYLIHHLLMSRNNRNLVRFEYHIIPVLNPDGYEYSWTKNRLWRKNRSPRGGGGRNQCSGVDLNRNFDIDWCRTGSSKDPCSPIYCGSKPFSEPETRALRDYALRLASTRSVAAFFTIHSYGQVLVYPWGFTNRKPLNWERLQDLTTHALRQINARFGNRDGYRGGQTSETLYPSSGGSDDWMLNKVTNISFCFELRDKGQKGFLLHRKHIVPAAEDAFVGINAILEKIPR